MQANLARHEKFWTGVKAILWFVLAVMFLLSIPVLKAWTWWLPLMAIAVGCLFALPVFLVLHFVKRKQPGYSKRGVYLRTAAALSVLLVCLTALPVYYCAYSVQADPVMAPRVVLTNGHKTIVIQGMVHIGTEVFYKAVAYDVERAIADGYHVHYEGVKPSSGEAERWFSEYMGNGGDLNDNYKTIASMCGLTFQRDYFELMESHAKTNPDQVSDTDVSHLELKNEFDRLMRADPEFAAAEGGKAKNQVDSGSMASLLTWLHDSGPQQQKIVGILGRGFVNYTIAGKSTPSQSKTNVRDRLILDYRNRYLAEKVLADPSDKIFILYGAAHIPGVVELLRQSDENWKVVSIVWQRAIAPPEQLDAQLQGVAIAKSEK